VGSGTEVAREERPETSFVTSEVVILERGECSVYIAAYEFVPNTTARYCASYSSE
jgi:hypothetical protein